jgi:ubiquinone/menaquinone biosynthesis C-methylase UbiE
MDAMRQLLAGEGDPETFEVRAVDALDVGDAYAVWAATYDNVNPLIVLEETALLSVLGGLPAGRAVDVAAGTGRLAAHLVRLGHDVVAVERADAMVRRAAEKDSGFQLVLGDALHLPLKDGDADLVTCALALTHMADLGPAFAELARVVRPGGAVVVSDVHPVAVATGAHAFLQREDGSRAVVRNEIHWPSAYVRASLAAGLTVERCEEAFVDESLLEEFGVTDMALAPDAAILGLPFALVWVFRRT